MCLSVFNQRRTLDASHALCVADLEDLKPANPGHRCTRTDSEIMQMENCEANSVRTRPKKA